MPEITPEAAHQGGVRFGNDLRRIRLARNVTLETVYEVTRVSPYIIEQLEYNVLDHPLFNNAYLRPLLQQIARAVDVDPARVLQGYDLARKGQYTNQLAVDFLDEEPEQLDVTVDDDTEPTEPSAPEEKAREEKRPQALDERKRLDESGSTGYLLKAFGMAIVTAAVLFWAAVSLGTQDEGSQSVVHVDEAEQVTPISETFKADTSALSERKIIPLEVEEATPAAPGDSIRVDVVAAYDRVDPIRVRVDNDLRRPYWIEKSDSVTFFVSERIIIEQRLDKVQLLVEGMEFRAEVSSPDDAVTITRADAAALLEQQARAQLHEHADGRMADT